MSVPRTVPALVTPPAGITAVKDACGVNYARTMASSVLAALPLVLVFVLFRRRIVKSVGDDGPGRSAESPAVSSELR
ncbi:hypothetical protein ACFWJE_01330 [Streptomyces griseoincarnatus]